MTRTQLILYIFIVWLIAVVPPMFLVVLFGKFWYTLGPGIIWSFYVGWTAMEVYTENKW